MYTTVSLLASRHGSQMPLFMRRFFMAVFVLGGLFLYGARASATVNVTFSSAAPNSLQTSFIAATTTQYKAVLTPSPYFANTYALVIAGLNPAYVPPVVSSPLATGTAVDAVYAYGFGNGMDTERYQGIQMIRSLQSVELSSGTCGGDAIGYSTATVSLSTATALYQCMNAYNLIVSTISERWGYIYDPKGARVSP